MSNDRLDTDCEIKGLDDQMDKASYAEVVSGYSYQSFPIHDELNQSFSSTDEPSTPLELPATPTGPMGLTLSWHWLSVWVKKVDESRSSWLSTKFKDEKILSKVSGIAEPGRIMAILGPSGAGKTTLLATISQRITGNMRGKVLVNGKEISKDLMLRISGFVPQKDLVLETLTVMEHLQFMARLMDGSTTKSRRNQIILSLLSEMGIVRVKNSRISQLSGGEKKRLSMAVQLLTDPAILFCDEPTTGLDSYSAMVVVEQCKKLAIKGKTVICTIHQPASGLLDMFDQVYLLASGGKMALFSDTDLAEKYFNDLGIYCPPTYNLAEFLILNLALENGEESGKRVENICKQYKNSKEFEDLIRKLELEVEMGEKTDYFHFMTGSDSSTDPISMLAGNEFNQYVSVKKPSKFVQIGWLTWRSFLDLGRNPKTFLIRFSLYLFMALLISIPYQGLTINQKGIQNLQGFLYLVIVETTFTFTYSVAHTFPAEIPLLLREIDAGLYTPDAYYVSKILTLIPRSIIEPTIYSIVTFFISGLFGGFHGFLKFCVPVIMASTAATAYGCLISALFKSISRATLLSVPYEQVALLFCGVFMALDDVPLQFAWVKYVSIFYYGLEFISILQWTQVKDIPCLGDAKAPCIRTGSAALDYYGYKESHMIVDFIGLISIYCIYHICGYLALWKRCKKPAAY